MWGVGERGIVFIIRNNQWRMNGKDFGSSSWVYRLNGFRSLKLTVTRSQCEGVSGRKFVDQARRFKWFSCHCCPLLGKTKKCFFPPHLLTISFEADKTKTLMWILHFNPGILKKPGKKSLKTFQSLGQKPCVRCISETKDFIRKRCFFLFILRTVDKSSPYQTTDTQNIFKLLLVCRYIPWNSPCLQVGTSTSASLRRPPAKWQIPYRSECWHRGKYVICASSQ